MLKPASMSFVFQRFLPLPQAARHDSGASPEYDAEHALFILAPGTVLVATALLEKKLF